MRCSEPGCRFVIYVEGEPTEHVLDEIVTVAISMHVANSHPDAEVTITPMEVPGGAVTPPDAAYTAPTLGGRPQAKKLQN